MKQSEWWAWSACSVGGVKVTVFQRVRRHVGPQNDAVVGPGREQTTAV